jgi:acetolactate synthase-1/2/3 large subunit
LRRTNVATLKRQVPEIRVRGQIFRVDVDRQVDPPIVRPALDASAAERIVQALAEARSPVIYVGGGVLSGRATTELAALAESLEVPVAHTLMGKGCLREDHPLLLGMTGFWGTPIANETCRNADLIVAIGTRLAEANSSSWDSRFTFDIPPTRLIHIDIDAAEILDRFDLRIAADEKGYENLIIDNNPYQSSTMRGNLGAIGGIGMDRKKLGVKRGPFGVGFKGFGRLAGDEDSKIIGQ